MYRLPFRFVLHVSTPRQVVYFAKKVNLENNAAKCKASNRPRDLVGELTIKNV